MEDESPTLKTKSFRLTSTTAINLYKTILRSRIKYGNSVIGSLDKSCFIKLEQFKLSALRFARNIHIGIKLSINANNLQPI